MIVFAIMWSVGKCLYNPCIQLVWTNYGKKKKKIHILKKNNSNLNNKTWIVINNNNNIRTLKILFNFYMHDSLGILLK